MPNQYVNEVIYNGQTLIDLQNDTVTPNKVLAGETFHDRSGAIQTGNLITHNVYDGLDSTSTDDALSAKQGKILNDNLNSKFQYKDYEFHNLSFSAGTIGTRGIQSSKDISNDISTYGKPVSVFIIDLLDSSTCMFQILISYRTLYLIGYRATDSAMNNNAVNVRVLYRHD